jgi:hypothetical protein
MHAFCSIYVHKVDQKCNALYMSNILVINTMHANISDLEYPVDLFSMNFQLKQNSKTVLFFKLSNNQKVNKIIKK